MDPHMTKLIRLTLLLNSELRKLDGTIVCLHNHRSRQERQYVFAGGRVIGRTWISSKNPITYGLYTLSLFSELLSHSLKYADYYNSDKVLSYYLVKNDNK